jgi:hypothetical protein
MELLVSVAIIGVLIAILLPAAMKVRRMALVLACPIAYQAEDRSVWLCDPEGKYQLQITGPNTAGHWIRWSPHGDKFLTEDPIGVNLIVNPASMTINVVPGLDNAVWIDNHTIIGTRYFGSYDELWRTNTDNGTLCRWKANKDMGLPYGGVTSDYNPILTTGFIACEADCLWSPTADVVLRDQDWNLGKTIWRDPNNDFEDYNVRLDYFGEYAAWSRGRDPGPGQKKVVAMKAIDAPSSDPPTLLGLNYENVTFCDWTPHGDLMVLITENKKRQLAILDKQGRLIRNISTPPGLGEDDGCATWRRYEHW